MSANLDEIKKLIVQFYNNYEKQMKDFEKDFRYIKNSLAQIQEKIKQLK